MDVIQRIRLGLLLANIKLGNLTRDASPPKDPDPKNWRTISGAKVHLTNGKIDGGAGGKFQGKNWVGREKHAYSSPKEPEKSKRTNKAAENLVAFIKKQAGVDLSKYRDTDYEKRGQLNISWNKLDKQEQRAVQLLAQAYGGDFTIEDNGGLGMVLIPKKTVATGKARVL